jgi:NADH dehydrogenase/NADH:ubiquinone oxidoreductase subunit G
MLGFKPAGRMDGASAIKALIVASATCTLEELYLAQRLAKECLDAPIVVARHVPDGVDDHLLRRADRHPNARGAEMLGLRVYDLQRGESGEVLEMLGGDTVLVTIGFNQHVDAIAPLWNNAGKVVALSGCKSALTERADLVAPGVTFAEKEGLVVNFEGQVQQLRPAMDPRAETEWRILDALLASLTGSATHEFIAHIRKAMQDSVPAFAGADLLKTGLHGVRVAGQPVAARG